MFFNPETEHGRLAAALLSKEGAAVTGRGLYYDGYSKSKKWQLVVWSRTLAALRKEACGLGMFLFMDYDYDGERGGQTRAYAKLLTLEQVKEHLEIGYIPDFMHNPED